MKKAIRYQQIKKIASNVGKKGAKGMNFSHAQNQLSEANPGMEFSKDEITRKISEKPLFSEESLDSIKEITIEDHHAERLNRAEKAFVEIGAFLTKEEGEEEENRSPEAIIGGIGDYLTSERAQPGWISKRYDVSLVNSDSLVEEFKKLDTAQVNWHKEEAAKAAKIEEEEGLFGNGYMTNEVVYDFGDGWKVVYVPAVGEGPNYKGDGKKSNDRTIEGNINGLCLGATQGLYQNNNSGKIYSVRDPKNNPAVTIRISDENRLLEAKGKNNLPPDMEAAIHADKWFKSQEAELRYQNSYDYKVFPPLTKNDAISEFNKNPKNAYTKGWVVNWFRQGVPEIDSDLFDKIKARDILVVYSGLGKKYKELAQPVVKHWTEKWNDESSSEIWGGFDPHSNYQLSHESWKTYKKEPWMRAAVEKLVKQRFEFGFKIGLQKIEAYKEIVIEGVKLTISSDPISFFKLKLQDDYPELGRSAAESLVEKDPYTFFRFKLQEAYPELGRPAAESLLEKDPKEFFRLKLLKTYPEWERSLAKSLAEKGPYTFFSYGFQKTYPEWKRSAAESLLEKNPEIFFLNKLQETYPELGRPAAESLLEEDPYAFFRLKIEEAYPELARSAAKSIAEKDPSRFFEKNFDETYPDLEESAAESLVEKDYRYFFRLKLHETYPELGRSAAESLLEEDREYFFENHSLHETYTELARPIAEIYAEKSPGYFFEFKLHETYPEIGRPIAESLAEKNLFSFFLYKLHKAYPELGRPAAESFLEKDPFRFFDIRLEEDYPDLSRPAAESLLEKNPSNFFRSTLPIAYPDLEESAAESLVEKRPGDLILFDLHKKYPELGRLAAEYFAKNNTAYLFRAKLHEIYPEIGRSVAESIAEKNTIQFLNYGLHKIYPEIGRPIAESLAERNPEYFFFEKKLYEIYPELGRPIVESIVEKNPAIFFQRRLGLYYPELNPNSPKNSTKSESEGDDVIKDKISKLYNYLVKSGFSKEAKILKEFTKVAVLKRLKRTTRGKGKRDRMEWALVSKSNPKKILKWFGPDKPTKKEVAKEERRVHAFG